jgi:adenylate kinase
MNIVMMGVQGCGKGTLSKLLSRDLSIPHVSVGDLFRANISQRTELGRKAKEYADKGLLVPDPIVIDMVKDRLGQPDTAAGFILDGFPRNRVQLDAMEHLRPIDHAVLLELDDEVATKRLAGRSECRKCGIIYGLDRQPCKAGVCDQCGSTLEVRADDRDADAVRKRVSLYHREIDGLVVYYESKKVLRRIPADASIEVVFGRLKSAVNSP